MKRAKAPILNLHSTSQLCDELVRILQSSSLLRRLRIESIELGNSTQLVSKVYDLISKFMPDIVFLVLSSNHLKPAVELVKDLRRQKTPSPLVAVLEKGKSDETHKLIEAVIDDFIAPQ